MPNETKYCTRCWVNHSRQTPARWLWDEEPYCEPCLHMEEIPRDEWEAIDLRAPIVKAAEPAAVNKPDVEGFTSWQQERAARREKRKQDNMQKQRAAAVAKPTVVIKTGKDGMALCAGGCGQRVTHTRWGPGNYAHGHRNGCPSQASAEPINEPLEQADNTTRRRKLKFTTSNGAAKGFALDTISTEELREIMHTIPADSPELQAIVNAVRALPEHQHLKITPPSHIRAKPFKDRISRHLRKTGLKVRLTMKDKVNAVFVSRA